MREAYVYAVGRGLLVAAGMTLLGAVVGFALVAREPAEELPPPEAAASEVAREPVGV
jgi:hypothetical protein